MSRLRDTAIFSIIIVLMGFTFFAFFWNISVPIPKLMKMNDFKNVDVTQLYTRLEDILSFHPEIGNEEVLMLIAYPAVADAIQHKIQDVSRLLSLVESYAEKDHSKSVIFLAKLYAMRYILNQKEPDYQKADKYYNLALTLRPNDGISLHDLFCLYRFEELLKPKELTPFWEVKQKITNIWGPIANDSRCTIGDWKG